jgi:hypothetical protein
MEARESDHDMRASKWLPRIFARCKRGRFVAEQLSAAARLKSLPRSLPATETDPQPPRSDRISHTDPTARFSVNRKPTGVRQRQRVALHSTSARSSACRMVGFAIPRREGSNPEGKGLDTGAKCSPPPKLPGWSGLGVWRATRGRGAQTLMRLRLSGGLGRHREPQWQVRPQPAPPMLVVSA